MATAIVPCEECEYQKRTGRPMTSEAPRGNPALREGDRVTLRTGTDAGKAATIVGRDGGRVKVKLLGSGTFISVRPQELDLARRNPSGSSGGAAGTLLLILGTISIVFGIILPVVLNRNNASAATP